MSTQDAYAVERRRRVLSRFVRNLGLRVAFVGDLPALRGVRPMVALRADAGGDVRARPEALPVASGALTGVVVRAPIAEPVVPVLAECCRLLQPGGGVLLVGECAAGAGRADPPALAASAGLELVRVTPVGALPAEPRVPSGLWGIDCAFDRLAARLGVGGDAPVERVVVLRRPGGDGVEIPSLGALVGGMVWRRRGRRPDRR